MDVLTIGSATIDAFLQLESKNETIRLDTTSKELRIKAGEKVEVDACTFSMGGNACNVAVGLSRLGFSAGVCAEIGDDEFAQKIINSLTYDHVDRTYLLQTPHTASSFAIALNLGAERTLFVEHRTREHNFTLESISPKWMYITSIGDKWEHAYASLGHIAKEKKITFAFNPGTHQLEKYSEEVKELLTLCKILFVNKQEAIKIVKFYAGKEEADIKNLLSVLHELGSKIVSITDGSEGGYAYDGENMWHIERFPQKAVERTGAGDAYATGFVAAQMEGKTVGEAMRYGAINAASVIGTIGAEAGLLTKEKLLQTLAQNQTFQPTQI